MNKPPRTFYLPHSLLIPGRALLAVAGLALVNTAWSSESLTGSHVDGIAEVSGAGSGVEEEAEPRQAPQVDLGEPVVESLPLQIVEQPATTPATKTVTEVAPQAQDSELARAPSVALEEPLTEAQPLEPAKSEGRAALAGSDGAGVAAGEAPVAENVDLGEPVVAAAPEAATEQAAEVGEVLAPASEAAIEPAPIVEARSGENEALAEVDSEVADSVVSGKAESAPEQPAVAVAEVEPAEKVVEEVVEEVPPLVMLGSEVAPGTSTRLSWSPSHSFEGIAVPTPVLVVNGAKQGPVLCLTAAVHGDELNGIEIVRRVLYNLDADRLSGTVVGVPIVNLQGFRRSSRYLPDRRDLNRFFPGEPKGSSAARIAYSFFNEVISNCDALVDLHTGSFYRTNLPQLRADLRDEEVLELSEGFDGTVVLQSEGAVGTLRQAAVAAGIPAVTLEAGEPMRLQEKEVNHGVKTIQSLLGKLGMVKKSSFWGKPEPVYYQSAWVRADQGGILFSEVDLGERVKKDEVLGTVTDPITNVRTEILSPYRGRVLGMALNQVVMPGFAAFRIGIPADESEVIDTAEPDEELSSTLHTSQLEKEREAPLPAAKPEKSYDDFEGLEDSE